MGLLGDVVCILEKVCFCAVVDDFENCGRRDMDRPDGDTVHAEDEVGRSRIETITLSCFTSSSSSPFMPSSIDTSPTFSASTNTSSGSTLLTSIGLGVPGADFAGELGRDFVGEAGTVGNASLDADLVLLSAEIAALYFVVVAVELGVERPVALGVDLPLGVDRPLDNGRLLGVKGIREVMVAVNRFNREKHRVCHAKQTRTIFRQHASLGGNPGECEDKGPL